MVLISGLRRSLAENSRNKGSKKSHNSRSRIIWKIIWNQKRTAEPKRSHWSPLVRYQKLAWEIPIPLDYFFRFFFKCQSIFFHLKNYLITLRDNTAKRDIDTHRHRAHWAVLGLGCTWLFVLHTRLNRGSRSVCRIVSDKGPSKRRTTEPLKKKKQRPNFRVFRENENGIQTQDTRDKQKLKSKTKTRQRSRWSTSTDAPSSCGRAGAQPWKN